MTLLIITGIGRTGTTITAKVINSHPDINMTNEKLVLWRMLQFISGLNISYPVKKDEYSIDVFDINEYWKIRGFIVSGLRESLKCIYEADKFNYFGDKFPMYLYYMTEIKEMFPDAKFIITYKNDFDYCLNSILASYATIKYDFNKEKFKDLWDRGMAIIGRNKNNNDIFILEQDKFRSNPKEEMDKVARFLGIENKFDISAVKSII